MKKSIIRKLANKLNSLNRFVILNRSTGTISKLAMLSNVSIEGEVNIREYTKVGGGVLFSGGKIDIGRYTSISGPNTDFFCKINSIKIGNFCSIARNVTMQEFNHRLKRIGSYFFSQNMFGENLMNDITSKGGIIIENDVWIGSQSVILSGTIIRNGAIIAANSVVNKEIPPYAIAAGSPAKVIGYRFDKDIIDILGKIQWWEWTIDKIKRNKFLFENDLTIDLLKDIIE